MATLKHPDLGNLHGVTNGVTTQFLGLRYGTLEHRLAESQIATPLPSKSIDASRYGPSVISPPGGVDFEFHLIQQSLPKPEDPGMSDVDGLNLNITVPSSSSGVEQSSKLPVFVFLHGGGFATGGNWWPQYDLAKFVALSVEKGLPIIAININYRLGLPGFITSKELEAAGIKPNRGLRDQRTALKWIARYIGGFGGDPDNMTVAGESAGSISTAYLLCSEEVLAKRLICMSGSPPMLRPLPRDVADIFYHGVLQSLGINDESVSDRVKALSEYPADAMLKNLAKGPPLLPVVDGKLIAGVPTYESIKSMEHFDVYPMPGKRKYHSMMVGDCRFDGSIVRSMLSSRIPGIATAFEQSLRQSLSSKTSSVDLILESYGINEPGISDEDSFIRVSRFGNDVCFFVPTASMAHGFPGETFLYAFNEPNSWDGPSKGYASHVLDVAFLFQNYNEKLPPDQKKTALTFAGHVFAYMYGQKPWPVFTDDNPGSMIYEQQRGGCEYTADLHESRTGRSWNIFPIAEQVGLDTLLDAWDGFIAGR